MGVLKKPLSKRMSWSREAVRLKVYFTASVQGLLVLPLQMEGKAMAATGNQSVPGKSVSSAGHHRAKTDNNKGAER